MYYPRNLSHQQNTIQQWRKLVEEHRDHNQPFMQPLYIDLRENDDFAPQPIHLGFRIGAKHLVEYFHQLKNIGVNHLAINLRFNAGEIERSMTFLAEKVLPHFHKRTKKVTS